MISITVYLNELMKIGLCRALLLEKSVFGNEGNSHQQKQTAPFNKVIPRSIFTLTVICLSNTANGTKKAVRRRLELGNFTLRSLAQFVVFSSMTANLCYTMRVHTVATTTSCTVTFVLLCLTLNSHSTLSTQIPIFNFQPTPA